VTVIEAAVPAGWTDGPPCRYPETTLTELLLDRARRSPAAVAVEQWARRLSYAGLVAAAERIAGRLRAAGVGPEIRVGICARRGIELPAAVLGVLLAGGAYVPLDPNHPRARLDLVLDDAGVEVVIVDPDGRALLAGAGRTLLDLEPAGPAGSAGAAEPAEPAAPADAAGPAGELPAVAAGGAGPDSAAYVMYTSGSTGRPKGVVVSHRNLVAFVTAAGTLHPLPATGRSAGFASLGFDTSVFDLLLPLTRGAAVALVPDADRVDPARLQRFLRAHRVSSAMLPPAVLPLLDPAALPELTDVFAAGEPCGPEQVARWSAPGHRFHNWYGPTETTVIVVGDRLSGDWDRPLPIGRPLPGCRAYVLDERLRPVPPGTPGELLIGGPQLARGYHRRPGHTADRFVPDPYGPDPGGRLYRTGDLVRWEPDGTIGFLGRLDRQVKIQGQRVEIGEVETAVRAHPEVAHAVVDVATRAGGLSHLVAYLAPAGAPDLAELRAHCATRLPVYMTPTEVIRLPELPLNVSGKVDLAALRARRDPAPSTVDTPVVDPSEVDGAVAAAWRTVFEVTAVRPDADFAAAGGHSLLAMRLVAELRSSTGRQVAIEDVYLGRTVAGLARRVAAAPPAADEVPTGSAPALSSGQRRMWFVEQLTPGTAVHNIALAERLRGPLDRPALAAALRAVAARHEALRWRVPHANGTPRVEVDPPADVPLPLHDLTDLPAARRERAVRDLLDSAAGAAFDLARGPLWRAALVRLGPAEHVLAVTVHHLVFDGWSWGVLYDDLAAAYREATGGPAAPPPPPAGFADYVAWAGARDGVDGAWWSEQLAGAPLVLDLPRDRDRPPVQTFHGERVASRLGPAAAGRVRAVAAAAGATPFAVLLAAFGQQLRRLTGRTDLVVGTPFADRRLVAFEGLIGFCVQVLPLRLVCTDDAGFTAHVRRTAAAVTAALAHPDLALDRLVSPAARDLSRNPVVQVLFNMYGFTGHRLRLPGLTAEPLPPGLPGALFDLTLYVDEDDRDGLALQAVYNPDLYDRDRVEALLAGYVHLLDQLCADPDRPVARARLRPPGSGLPGWDPAPPRWAGPGVVERVAAVAATRPDRLAVTGPATSLTAREVLELAAGTAAQVRGTAAGATVAVVADRDVRLPAVLLGLLGAGRRWLVVDSALPPAARDRLLAAADPALTIRPADISPRAGTGWWVPPAERGYLAATSGSTGEPALVLAAEAPLAHFLDRWPGLFGLAGTDRFALLAGLGHDPLLRDVFLPLALGAHLSVPEQAWLRDPATLRCWLAEQAVTVAHFTPQLGRMLAGAAGPELPALRLLVLAGDQLRHADTAALRRLAPAARIVNGYGATETPQLQAWHEPAAPAAAGLTGAAAAGGPAASGAVAAGPAAGGRVASGPVPVGHGFDGTRLLVLTPTGVPAGVGELGEVVIRGRHLATGYLATGYLPAGRRPGFGRPPNPDGADDRVFRTGDLGRYRPDGAVVLAGRADGQVKIRGHRLELAEVEATLAAHPDVLRASAIATAGDEPVLRAFAVPARPGVRTQDLLAHLRGRLGEHAVPADLTLLPDLPLTGNGKVDRAALAAAAPRPRPTRLEEPASRTELLVAGIWREVLGRPRLAVTDNFFEVGGHSLAVLAVGARLARLGRDVPVVDLFRFPTIRSLAAHLDGSGTDRHVERGARRAEQRRERARRRTAPPTPRGTT
jgi:amino acid adenylation domain-containing protein